MTAIINQRAMAVFLLLILNQFEGVALCADTIFLKNGMRMDVERAWKENGEVKYAMCGAVYSRFTGEVARIETETAKWQPYLFMPPQRAFIKNTFFVF